MSEALESRISYLEDLLGVTNKSNTFNNEISSLKKRLQELEAGYLMKLSVSKLRRLQQVYSDRSSIPLKDKIRSVEFSSNLMEKRAHLLEELQKTSDVVLNSDRFDNLPFTQLEEDNKTIKEVFEIIRNFYDDLQNTILQLHTKLEAVQSFVRKLENDKLLKEEKET